jgi:hypothetical protein
MKRMRKLTAIMILAAVATLSTPTAFAGAVEVTGRSRSGIMIGDSARTGIMIGDSSRTGIMIGDIVSRVLTAAAGIMIGDVN